MFLSDVDIDRAIRAGSITLRPFEARQLQPASYDIRLGNEFVIVRPHSAVSIDPARGIYPEAETVQVADGEPMIIQPSMTVIGYSKEYFGSEEYLIEINSKSSLSRVGLLVHNASGIVNPGHFLSAALVLTNLMTLPIIMRPDMPIAQLVFSPLSSATKKAYKGTSLGQGGYVPPRSGPLARERKQTHKK